MLQAPATQLVGDKPPHTLPWRELCLSAWAKVQQRKFMAPPKDEGHSGALGHDLALKFNSTSSIHLRDTVIEPDIDELTWCAAMAIEKMIKPSSSSKAPELFDEVKHPLHMNELPWPNGYKFPTPPLAPKAEDIFLFINPVVYKLRVKPESTVMCMVYLNRLCAAAHFTLDPFSWRWATLSCLALATKVYEDLAIWNADFKEAFPQLSVAELNTLELALLKYLNFTVEVNRSTYATEFFSLKDRSLHVRSNFLAKPLSERDLDHIEHRTVSQQKKWNANGANA